MSLGVIYFDCKRVCVCGSVIDAYGFERPENFDARTHEEFMAQYLGVLVRRASRWSRYMHGRKRVSKSAKCMTLAPPLLAVVMLAVSITESIEIWFANSFSFSRDGSNWNIRTILHHEFVSLVFF